MSTIKVDTITDEAGSGAPDFPNGMTGNGSSLTGLATAAQGALAATALQSSSSLEAANLTGTLPAIDGSALTGVGASTTFGDVGTYVFARRDGSTSDQAAFVAGSTYAGNTLYPSGISGNQGAALLFWSTSVSTLFTGDPSSAALSGTWRAMGSTSIIEIENPVTLFVRIS